MKVIVCWHWGNKYSREYVDRLAAGVKRNLKQPHRFVCVSEGGNLKGDFESWELLDTHLLQYGFGTIARMRLFDNEWQRAYGIGEGDDIVNIDIDTIITGYLDSVLCRKEDFIILQNINTTNPNPYNGSFWMVKAGIRHDAWADFNVELWSSIKRHAKLSDQDWLRYKFPDAAEFGPDRGGVYGFKKRGWVMRRKLPDGANVITFPGRDPADYQDVDWVRQHWLGTK